MKSLTIFALLFLALYVEARTQPKSDKADDSAEATQDHIVFGGSVFGQSGDEKDVDATQNLFPTESAAKTDDSGNVWFPGPATAADANGAAENFFGPVTAEENGFPWTSDEKSNAEIPVAENFFAKGPVEENLFPHVTAEENGFFPWTSEEKSNAEIPVAENFFAKGPVEENLFPHVTAEENGFFPWTAEEKSNAEIPVAENFFAKGPVEENLFPHVTAEENGFFPWTSDEKSNAEIPVVEDFFAKGPVAENIAFGPFAENNLIPFTSEEKTLSKYFNFGDLSVRAKPPCAEMNKGDCATLPKVTHMRPVYTRCGGFGITHNECEAASCAWLPSPIGNCWAVEMMHAADGTYKFPTA